MFANGSFYNGMNVFAGLTFGAFEYALMIQGAFMRLDVVVFLLLSACPLIFLLALKNIREGAQIKTYILARPYRHIFADFLYHISVAATFATLVFVYTRGLRFIEPDLAIPPHTGVLFLNLAMFAGAMILFSILAKSERRKEESALQTAEQRLANAEERLTGLESFRADLEH